MLAVLLVVALFGYAIVYRGILALSDRPVPGFLESLSPTYSGVAAGGGATAPPAPGAGGATPQLQTVLAALAIVPGWSLLGICATSGHVDNSEHYTCNAADVGGPLPVLQSVSAFLVFNGRAGTLPIHCVIGPGRVIRSRENGWKARPYTGPSDHKGHVHVSGWPSVGGGC